MDQRAQISVEYILLVAIILAIVLVFALIITNQNEQNIVATAAQLGASNATANMVFTNNSQSPIKVTSVTMTNNSNNINMIIHFSSHINNQTVILNSIATSLNSALNGSGTSYTIAQNSNNINLVTNKNNYTITLS